MSAMSIVAGQRSPRVQDEPGLEGHEADGGDGLDGGALDRPGEPVDARGDVDGQDRAGGGVEDAGHEAGVAVQGPPEAGAEHGVYGEVGAVQCPDEGGAVDAGQVETVDPRPPGGQALGGDPAVGAVVALAADDHHPAAVGAPEEAAGAPGDGSPGPVDQGRLADPAGDGGGIPGGHLSRCEDWAHLTQWYGDKSHAPWTWTRPAVDQLKYKVAGGGGDFGSGEAGAASCCHATAWSHAARSRLRGRFPVGRHHGQDARAGHHDHDGVDHHDHDRGTAAPARRPSPTAAQGAEAEASAATSSAPAAAQGGAAPG